VPPGDIRAMAHVIDDVDRLSPEDCRTDMQARFSVNAMLDGYESFFREIQATGK
jgi:hypothetical protein